MAAAASPIRGSRVTSAVTSRFFVSRAEQAKWLTAAYRLANRAPYISGLGWFNLQDQNTSDGLTDGLLDTAGVPKPDYYAYQRAP